MLSEVAGQALEGNSGARMEFRTGCDRRNVIHENRRFQGVDRNKSAGGKLTGDLLRNLQELYTGSTLLCAG